MSVHVYLSDGLFEAPVEMSAAQAFERAASRGILAPFPRPQGDISVEELLLNVPIVGDAFVHSLGYEKGEKSVRSPRAAIGIDTIGAAMLGITRPLSVTFRGLTLTRASVSVQEHESVDACAEALERLMAEGKVFSFFASGTRLELLSGDCATFGARKSADAWLDAFAIEPVFEKSEPCVSLNPRDKGEVLEALNNNILLLGSPVMGRLGSYNEHVASRDIDRAFETLCEGLRHHG